MLLNSTTYMLSEYVDIYPIYKINNENVCLEPISFEQDFIQEHVTFGLYFKKDLCDYDVKKLIKLTSDVKKFLFNLFKCEEFTETWQDNSIKFTLNNFFKK